MRIRGTGFRIPWVRKICSQLSRGTVWTRTVRSSAVAKARAISFGDTRGSLQLDDARPAPFLLEKHRRQPPDILRRHHRDRFVCRLQEAAQHTFVARRGNVPERVLHEPGGPQQGDR
jgi:hypothetical protein